MGRPKSLATWTALPGKAIFFPGAVSDAEYSSESNAGLPFDCCCAVSARLPRDDRFELARAPTALCQVWV